MAAFATAQGERIKRELQAAGVSTLGLLKFSLRYLPQIIGEGEHIQAVVYGRYRVGEGSKSWGWEEGALVATDARVLFVDRKPAYLQMDSMLYGEVSTAQSVKAWPFSEVTVASKAGKFSLRYVKMALADKFVNYVEERRTK